jgi:putative hydrolase of the HAD superfamily
VTTFDALVIDVGGVLFVPDIRKLEPHLSSRGMHTDVEHVVRAHYVAAAALDRLKPDEPIGTTYIEAFISELGGSFDDVTDFDDIFMTTDQLWFHLLPDAAEALRELAASGVPIAVVSNSNGTVEAQLRSTGVCQVGDGDGVTVAAVVDSFVFGVEKPDPAVFAPAIEALGIEPEQAVYIGDTVRFDVAGARAAGLHPVHLDPYGFCPRDDHDHVSTLAGVRPYLLT